MTVEFECDGDTVEVMRAAREQAVSEIAEMDHYEKINWVPTIVTIKEQV